MDDNDIRDMKARWSEHLVNDVQAQVAYRSLSPDSSTNSRFGIVENEVVEDTLLYANVIVRPSDKVKNKWGVTASTTLIAILATHELEIRNVVTERETGAVVYEGLEYEILNIDPRPQLFGTSIMTVLACKEREPLRE